MSDNQKGAAQLAKSVNNSSVTTAEFAIGMRNAVRQINNYLPTAKQAFSNFDKAINKQ